MVKYYFYCVQVFYFVESAVPSTNRMTLCGEIIWLRRENNNIMFDIFT